MIRFLLDENFNGRVARAFLARYPEGDMIRAQDTEMYQAHDRNLILWAAEQNRLLLTHDKTTLPDFLREIIEEGLPLCGVVVVPPNQPIGGVVDDLASIAFASELEEWIGKVLYLPLAKRQTRR